MDDQQKHDQTVNGESDPKIGLNSDIPGRVLGILAAGLLVVLLIAMFLPSMGKARHNSPELAEAMRARQAEMLAAADAQRDESSRTLLGAGLDRKLIRTATIRLRVDDIHAVARKAVALLDLSSGEYAGELSIQGPEGSSHGSLTLRVRSERLEAVIESLGDLGEIDEVSITSKDVTDTLVDLAAQIRNEKRIEEEILELMNARSGDPLDQVLGLRRELARIRGSIERMEARQASMERSVALATIHVHLNGHAREEIRAGFWGTTGARIGESWSAGWDLTSRTFAGLVEIVIGGLIWWVGLAFGSAAIWKTQRRLKERSSLVAT